MSKEKIASRPNAIGVACRLKCPATEPVVRLVVNRNPLSVRLYFVLVLQTGARCSHSISSGHCRSDFCDTSKKLTRMNTIDNTPVSTIDAVGKRLACIS